MTAAAAAGKALITITCLRPSLSDREPRKKEPSTLAILSTPMTQPVSCKVSVLAVRSNVGVHAAELQNTEPPINSASARMKRGPETASLNETERVADFA